jgi:hypothetical protein
MERCSHGFCTTTRLPVQPSVTFPVPKAAGPDEIILRAYPLLEDFTTHATSLIVDPDHFS